MRILFALPGFHRFDRGAETALIALARELVGAGDSVTLIGAGKSRLSESYRFLRAPCISRDIFERFPSVPILRNEYAYEELSFVPGLLWQYRPNDYDVTVTCSYPFTNWFLRRLSLRVMRPRHVFVTQNGDWPAFARQLEYRLFGCDGLVCTNPDYYERNKARWRCRLIPNGVNCDLYRPGTRHREMFGLPENRPIVLMVSALIPSKRIEVGIDLVSRIPDVHLVVAGDGQLRREIELKAARMLDGRFTRLSVSPEKMPFLYRCANLLLHLSKDESFGNVFVEALATGLPIVGHDSPRTRWIVGNDQYLANTDDLSATIAAIEMALSSPPTRITDRLSRAANFSWPKIADEYRQFLQEVISSDNK